MPQCLTCRAETINEKYCSQSCYAVAKKAGTVEAWLSGKRDGLTSFGQPEPFVRRWVFERDGGRCASCGWCEVNEFTGKSPLHMDHIDGNWANNRPENLRLLCPNCDSLTQFYKGANKGNGRPHRRWAPA